MAAEQKSPSVKQKHSVVQSSAEQASAQHTVQPAVLPLLRTTVQRAQADPGSLSRADVDALQRTIGMRATQRILANRAPPRVETPHETLVQTKLAVGPAGDKYEQEADAVARRVVEQSPAPHSPVATAQVAPRVQRKVTIEEVEEEPVRQPEPPREIVQPSTPLMLADAPWSEVEARESLARRERSQAEDPPLPATTG